VKKQALSVLAADDEAAHLEFLAAALTEAGHIVDTASDGIEAINKLQTSSYDLTILDIKMPRVSGIEVVEFIQQRHLSTDVVMVTGVEDIPVVVHCMRLGAYDYLTKPCSAETLNAVVKRVAERRQLLRENSALKAALSRLEPSGPIIGQSRCLTEVLSLAAKAAPSDSPILIEGPSGCGKELIAHYIHRNSSRTGRQFLSVNCASMPEHLLESELFGHERGAFTGAVTTKQGLVEIVDGGTLFLDEIGEISLGLQPKLLRWLQTGEFRRVGGNRNLRSDVRIVSATNKVLQEEVVNKRFREDLFFRLNVITLTLPRLKDRKEDIPLLVEHFVRKKSPAGRSVSVDQRAVALMQSYDWPGNVRELENVIERALIVCSRDTIRAEDIALPGLHQTLRSEQSNGSDASHVLGHAASLEEIEKLHIEGVLKLVHWNKKLAAQILGISLKTLYTKIHSHHLEETR
jgi:DNA-binding NtrC family response regulator